MDEKDIIQKLAIERCRMNVTHILALQHLVSQDDAHDSASEAEESSTQGCSKQCCGI